MWLPNLSNAHNVWIILAIKFVIGIFVSYTLGYFINKQIIKDTIIK